MHVNGDQQSFIFVGRYQFHERCGSSGGRNVVRCAPGHPIAAITCACDTVVFFTMFYS